MTSKLANLMFLIDFQTVNTLENNCIESTERKTFTIKVYLLKIVFKGKNLKILYLPSQESDIFNETHIHYFEICDSCCSEIKNVLLPLYNFVNPNCLKKK